jgi:hypothetical protein
MGKPNTLGFELPRCHFMHHKCHMKSIVFEPEALLPGVPPSPTLFSCQYAFFPSSMSENCATEVINLNIMPNANKLTAINTQ